jgi:hypothetical protein
MSSDLNFPLPLRMNGRLFWRRSELESFKRRLMASALGEAAPETAAQDQIEIFVPSDQVAREFGFGRRTLGRRIAGRRATGAAAE